MKHALIFGASGDIGGACARKLAAQGWSLYLHYNQNKEKLTFLQNELTQQYRQQDFYPVQMDMNDEAQMAPFLKQIFQVDALIFANGSTVYKLFSETHAAEMEALWQSMLKTPMLLCKALQPKLAEKAGRIVFVSSIYGLMGSAMEVLYSTIKGAQHAFVDAYAQEVASLKITVNAVAPGAVNTAMNQSWTIDEKKELCEKIPLQRMAEPSEVAATIAFLLSEEAGYLTGSVLPVTGGWRV